MMCNTHCVWYTVYQSDTLELLCTERKLKTKERHTASRERYTNFVLQTLFKVYFINCNGYSVTKRR